MAEAVGLAASIAGLVGITGQIVQGGLFLREFFEDVRDAPEEVQDLKDELELFVIVSIDTKNLALRAEQNQTFAFPETFARTLQRCLSIVDNIGGKLDQYAGRGNTSRRGWWARMKVASRKKTLAEYLKRLERAKSQLVILQANMTQSFLLHQIEAIQVTQTRLDVHYESVSQIAVVTKEIQDEGRRVINHIQGLDSKSAHASQSSEGSLSDIVLSGTVKRLQEQGYTDPPPEFAARYLQPSVRQSGRIKSKRTIDFWVMRVEVVNKEGDAEDQYETTDTAGSVSISAYFRIPFFSHRTVTVTFERPPFKPGFDMQLRTCNIRPYNSPIFAACRTFDLPQVKQLFHANRASPMDYRNAHKTSRSGGAPISLIDIVLEMVSRCHSSQVEDIQQGVILIRFLLPFYHHAPSVVNPAWFNNALLKMNSAEDDKAMAPYLEVIRSILRQSDVNPFEVDSSFGYEKPVSYEITLEKSELGIAKLLLEQRYHSFDPDHDIDGVFLENDRQLLNDPQGIAMRHAVRNGARYRTTRPLSLPCPRDGEPTGMHAIIDAVANSADHPRYADIEGCCRNRLVFFIESGGDIYAPRTGYYGPRYDDLSRLSPVQLAIALNKPDFFRAALDQVGWSRDKIDACFPRKPLDISRCPFGYLSNHQGDRARQRCRELFARRLINGYFLNYSETMIEEVDDEAVMSLGTRFGEISHVIKDANTTFKLKSTPGSWNEGAPLQLIPGTDFDSCVATFQYTWPDKGDDIGRWLQNTEDETDYDGIAALFA